MSFSAALGGGSSRSRGYSTSTNEVWDQQAPYLSGLYQAGQDVANSQAGIGQAAANLSGALMGSGSQALAGLGGAGAVGGAVGGAGMVGGLGAFGNLAAGNTAGQQVLAGQATGGSPVLQEQISALGSDLSRFYNQTIMPGIQGEAVAVNAMGNNRRGIAEGLGAQSVTDAFQQGATQLRGQDQAQRLMSAQGLIQSQMGGAQGLAGLGASGMGQGIQANQAAIGGLSDLYGLGMSPFQAQFMPLQNLAQLLGPAVMESDSYSEQKSKAWNFDTSGSFSMMGGG